MHLDISMADKGFVSAFVIGIVCFLASSLLGDIIYVYLSMILIGFVFLIKGADFLVDGGSAIAEHFGISHMIIGLTIVAFGTSAPEFVVSVYASIIGSGGISIGNIVGSNIFNILMVIGLPAVISRMPVEKKTAKLFDFIFMIMSGALLFFFLYITIWDAQYSLGLVDGIVFLALFLFFIKKMVSAANKEKERYIKDDKKTSNLKMSAFFIVIGIAGIFLGGQVLVENGKNLALSFGIPEVIIGLTLMAFGTSLPELATSIIAAIKKRHDIAIGNVVGSNIFNTLLVAGSAAIVRPITGISTEALFVDIPFMVFVSMLLLAFMRSGNAITRKEGCVLILLYASFLFYLLLFYLLF
ncbi:MAG: calcium/sodium antiporter [Candidatus Micrarchaeota archaeon]|nr:calcium/sodium antiporter [Candidatus Micrarchaeota archaeon]